MDTQADSAQACACALGKSLDGSGVPEPPSEHIMLNVEPVRIQRNDIYKWDGSWRTVSSVLALSTGGVAVYFKELANAPLKPAIIPEGILAVTVYRPKNPE